MKTWIPHTYTEAYKKLPSSIKEYYNFEFDLLGLIDITRRRGYKLEK